MRDLMMSVGDEGGGHNTPNGVAFATPQPIDPPIELPIHEFDLELYVKKKEDLTIAHMLILKYYNGGVDVWEDGEPPNPLMIQYERGLGHSDPGESPERLRHVTHAHSVAGAGAAGDALEAQLLITEPEGESWGEEDEPGDFANCTGLSLRLFRHTHCTQSIIDYPGWATAKYGLPVTVADMPEILGALKWSE